MSDMTPREAADEFKRQRPQSARTVWGRVLIDHARATSPAHECGDLDALAATITRIREDICASPNVERDTGWAFDERLTDVERRIWTITAPTPSVAAPPREDEGAEKQPGAFYELAVLRRFADGGQVDLATAQQQVGALLRVLPVATEAREGDEKPSDVRPATASLHGQPDPETKP